MFKSLEALTQDPIVAAFNPSGKQFMRAVALPPALNPYAESHGIQMHALIPFGVFPHIKAIPAFQMLWDDVLEQKHEGKHTIVVPSSGNTAQGVARLARSFGFTRVKIPMSSDVPASKTGMLRALGDWIDVLQVGHPLELVRELESLPGHYHLDQYSHMGNPRSHMLFTGPEILRVLGDRISVVAAAMGSSGTAYGLGQFFKAKGVPALVLGVRPKPQEEVPGARNEKAMAAVVRFPWHDTVGNFVEIGRKESFERARRLWQAVEPQPGPTSGMAWAGLERYLRSLSEERLEELRGTSVAFLCPDDARFYSDLFLAELVPEQGVQ